MEQISPASLEMSVTPPPEDGIMMQLRPFPRDADFSAVLSDDRTGLRAVREPSRRLKVLAWFAVFGVFWWGWGSGTVRAVNVAITGEVSAMHYSDATIMKQAIDVSTQLALVTVALVLVALFRRIGGSRASRFSWPLTLATIPIAVSCSWLGFLVSRALTAALHVDERGYPVPTTEGTAATVFEFIDSLMAGPTEELALTLLLVVALRTVSTPWWLVLVAAVVVRVPFHIYYGWGYVALAVWPLLTVLLYRLTGQIIGIVVAQSLFNATSYLQAVSEEAARELLLVMGIFVAVVLLIAGAYRHRDTRTADEALT